MRKSRDKEMAAVGAIVMACMNEMGIGSSKGAKALFCIACCAAMEEKDGKPWRASQMAHQYASFIGSTQTAVWQGMWWALRRAGWPGKVSEAIYGLARWGADA